MFRITFRQESVKRMKEELEKAYVRGDKQAVRRLSVLIMNGKRLNLGETFEAHSAGLEPKGLHPLTVAVMQEIGIDISGQAYRIVCIGPSKIRLLLRALMKRKLRNSVRYVTRLK